MHRFGWKKTFLKCTVVVVSKNIKRDKTFLTNSGSLFLQLAQQKPYRSFCVPAKLRPVLWSCDPGCAQVIGSSSGHVTRSWTLIASKGVDERELQLATELPTSELTQPNSLDKLHSHLLLVHFLNCKQALLRGENPNCLLEVWQK